MLLVQTPSANHLWPESYSLPQKRSFARSSMAPAKDLARRGPGVCFLNVLPTAVAVSGSVGTAPGFQGFPGGERCGEHSFGKPRV